MDETARQYTLPRIVITVVLDPSLPLAADQTAKNYAQDTISLSETAEQVGYGYKGQLMFQFRKVIGASPKLYRRRSTDSQ